MKLRLIAAAAGAMALLVAACGQKTEEAAPAAIEATEEAAPADETGTSPAAEQEAAADATQTASAPPACVMDVPSGAICTMDINACGHASVCNCGEGYAYNAALGKCLLMLDGVGEATVVQVDDNECVASASVASRCTRDINACGQPSNCSCDEGFVWNDVVGKCLKDLTAPTE
ncbi:MAG: hypothetical protein VX640_13990 [Pseudomonadota bacterium]|nr:hypothetical protein [Pseudomonadota bacterium]